MTGYLIARPLHNVVKRLTTLILTPKGKSLFSSLTLLLRSLHARGEGYPGHRGLPILCRRAAPGGSGQEHSPEKERWQDHWQNH
jgi:hypothetical protein